MAPLTAADPGTRLRQGGEALAATLPPLLVAAERVAATVAQGVHGRRRVGMGESFWQFRRYQPGDALHAIDWRQTAKSQAVFVREYEWEASQTVWLWRDGSGSMAYRSAPALPTKRNRADLLLLALASLLSRAGERVALLGGGTPPAAGRVNLTRIAAELERAAGVVAAVERMPDLPPIAVVPRQAELVLFGDFLAPLEDIQRVVAGYAERGVRGHLVQVLDPAEQSLPFSGRVRFTGLEGEGEHLVPRVEAVRDRYVERLRAQQEGLALAARSAGWSCIVHHTDRPAAAALLALYVALGQPRAARTSRP